MAITHIASSDDLRDLRALGAINTWELIERLKQTYSEGKPFDDSVVWEVANRLLDAEYPNKTRRIENGSVVEDF